MRHNTGIWLVSGLVLAACGGAAVPRPLGPVPVEARLFYDNGGGIRDSSTVVIRDAPTLQRYWAQATSTQSSPPPAPTIDFNNQRALLVSGGRMPPDNEIHVDSAGIRAEPTADGKEKDVLAVHFTITEGCRRINRDAYPVEIVRIRKYDGEVRFNGHRERPTNCR
jgi:hypothetical protein